MLDLFKKKSKVKEGKQTQTDTKATDQKKKESPIVVIQNAWKKLNSMDRKQAYTWGAVALVAFIGLLILFSAAGGNQDDFTEFETRGYDLANMPFSSDEAEQYLLANKYPDMKEGNEGMGLYSEEEKEARQEEDAENSELEGVEAADSNYREGRYYSGGSGRAGSGARTKVGSLSSANLKGASGSGINSKFGPSGDFSNFRSQNKGYDKAPGKGRGTGNARTALRQTAMASRAAAGLKNDKLLNAKKALMGGKVDGSNAFMDDSGAVNLGEAKGLELDTNAPVSSGDLSGLDQGLNDAKDQAQKDATDNDDEENSWAAFFRELGQELIKNVVQGAVSLGLDAAKQGIADARQIQALDQKQLQEGLQAEAQQAQQIQSLEGKMAGLDPDSPEYAKLSDQYVTQRESYQQTFGQEYSSSAPRPSSVKQFKTQFTNYYNSVHANNKATVTQGGSIYTMGGNNNSGTWFQDENGKYQVINGVKHYQSN